MKELQLIGLVASIGCIACAAAPSRGAQPHPQDVELCSVENGALVNVNGTVDATSLDTILLGRPLQMVYQDAASPFAIQKEWFQSHAPLEFRNKTYYKNAPPRRFRKEEVALVGQFGATPIFIDAGVPPEEAAIIYVLQDATCLFQSYYEI